MGAASLFRSAEWGVQTSPRSHGVTDAELAELLEERLSTVTEQRDAALVCAERMGADLEKMTRERDDYSDRLFNIACRARRVKESRTELERNLALSMLLHEALYAEPEGLAPCPDCDCRPCHPECSDLEAGRKEGL